MNKYSHKLTKILNIESLLVLGIYEDERRLIVSTQHQHKRAKCPICNTLRFKLHQNYSSLVRDLPIGERDVYLRINRRRFKCEVCQKIFNEFCHLYRKEKVIPRD